MSVHATGDDPRSWPHRRAGCTGCASSRPGCPWQNPYAERIIGSIRRECLDHVIVLSEDHLLRVLGEYVVYYHSSRPHLSLARNAPIEREIEPPTLGRVVSEPQVGGLHHRYRRAA